MAFDPDKYLSEKQGAAGGGFDPDRYLSEKAAPVEQERGPLMSFIHALGAPSRFAKEKATQAMDAAGIPDGPEFGGGIPQREFHGQKLMPEWATNVEKVTPKEMAANAVGMAADPLNYIPLVGKGVGGALERGAGKAATIAENRAFRALGPIKRDARINADEINDIGRTLLDSGVIKGAPKSYEELAQAAGGAADKSGENIGQIIEELAADPSVGRINAKEMAANAARNLKLSEAVPGAASKNAKVKSLLSEFVNSRMAGRPAQELVETKVSKLVDEFGNPIVTESVKRLPEIPAANISKAHQLKSEIGNEINWNRLPGADIPPEEQVQRSIYNELRQFEDAATESAAQSGNETAKNLISEKKKYGNLKEAAGIAERKHAAETANQTIGLGDKVVGGAAAGVGASVAGPVGAAVGGVAGGSINKLARTYGNQVTAQAADAISRKLMQSKALADIVAKVPAVYPALVEQAINESAIDRKLKYNLDDEGKIIPTKYVPTSR